MSSKIRYIPAGTSARFTVPRGGSTALDHAVERWLEDWYADDPAGTCDDASWQVTLPYALWLEAGLPPPSSAELEELDLFESRHSTLAHLVGLTSQRIAIETIGHVGSPELSFLFSVDGHRLSDMSEPTPFPADAGGVTRPLTPSAFVMFERVCRFNAKGFTTRAEQLVFVSELRSHLDRAAAALASAMVGFSFELEPHLSEFRSRLATNVSLGWKPHKNGKVFDLQLESTDAEGQKREIDLNRLDPDNPIIELSATEQLVLPPDVDAVARVAKKQRNKLRKHVEPLFNNPNAVIPEGLAIENIDLSAYSPRVTGFAPIVKAERAFDIQSSGVDWYVKDNDGGEPFLRLFISQPAGGGVETLEIATPDDAERVVGQMQESLAQPVPSVISIGDRQVEPTQPLLARIQQDLETYRAKEAGAAKTAKPVRIAATISDAVPLPTRAGERVEAPLPWDILESLLAPGIALKDHQRGAIEWLWRHYKQRAPGVLLADDMGLGKTLQIAAFMAMQRAAEPEAKPLPNLIVAPVILLDNWKAELEKFFRPAVFESLLVLYGKGLRDCKQENSLDGSRIASSAYVLTNYETLQSYQQSLLLLDWNIVVLDEAQAIKNPDTYRARAARGLKRRFGICSTGTPVENRLSDLWGLYDFLRPGDPFTTLKDFETSFESDEKEGIGKVRAALSYPSAGSSLLRRTKSEVLTLPPKSLEVHKIAMSPRQLELERSIVQRGKREAGVLQILQDLQRLYQHPRLLAEDSDGLTKWSVAAAVDESPKLKLCIDILRGIQKAGEKALVFTLWTRMQDLLVEVMKAELGLSRVNVINGNPAQRRHAKRYIDELEKTEGFGVLVLSPLAAGTGLTITAANHVIHYGRWWNPAKEDQATDRAYRIGQNRPVRVHYPLLHHPGQTDLGFDIKLHELVEKKRGMARDFLAPQADDLSMRDFSQLQEEA